MSIYNLRTAEGGSFRITKFDDELNVESSYTLSPAGIKVYTCDCPAGQRPSCRHRHMLPRMLAHVDDGWFYDYERQNWHRPIAAEGGSEPVPEGVTVVSLEEPEILHNAVAEAVGEPPAPKPQGMRR